MSARVTISITDGVADVRLNRPDKRNALDNEMFRALADVGERLKTEPSLRAVLLSGEGKSFCAGLDFGSFQAMTANRRDQAPANDNPDDANAEPDDARTADAKPSDDSPGSIQPGRITHLAQQVCWVWQEIPVPVIAAVHGHAMGGGFQIALGADIRIVHPDTRLSVREVHWGLVPDMTATLVLARLVRADVAKELTFTARVLTGTEAFELGLATRLSDTPLDDALALAAEIARRSPDAVRGAKQLLNRIVNAGAAEQFGEERRVIGSLIGSPNQVEAVRANFDNRPAQFS